MVGNLFQLVLKLAACTNRNVLFLKRMELVEAIHQIAELIETIAEKSLKAMELNTTRNRNYDKFHLIWN